MTLTDMSSRGTYGVLSRTWEITTPSGATEIVSSPTDRVATFEYDPKEDGDYKTP